jgi:polysaccharide biosynthesis transport protein
MNPALNTARHYELIDVESSDELSWQKSWDVLKRRWFSIALVTGTVFGITTVYTLRKSPTYMATGKLLFKADRKPEMVGLKSTTADQLQALTQKSDPLNTQAEILRSQQIVRSTIAAFKLKDKQGKPLDEDAFVKRLDVKAIAGTDILQISYWDESARRAAEVVNYLMRVYIKQNVASNKADAIAAKDFIVKQLPASEKAVGMAESQLRGFKQRNGVVALEQESTNAVDGIANLDRQIAQVQSQFAQANGRANELMAQVGVNTAAGLRLNALNQSEGVQRALTELQEVQQKAAKERARFQTKHPAIDALQRQETEAKTVLRERVTEVAGAQIDVPNGRLQIGKTKQEQIATLAQAEVDRLSLIAQLRSLVNARNAYAERARRLPELEKTQRELQRQLEAAQSTYKTLLTRLQEVNVAANQTVGNAEIVANAESPRLPVGPKIWLNLFTGATIGLGLGILLAFILNSRDRSVKTIKDANHLFDYPLLGTIPKVKQPKNGNGYTEARVLEDSFPAQEAYQILSTHLKYVLSNPSVKTIVVTSSVGKEGKSTVAANLAVAMAHVQKRVLLVDADFRNPCQHHVWDLINRGGLSNVVVGQLSVNAAVHAVMPNLHVLTAGSIPPSAIAILDSRRMADLVESLRDRYDIILFDSPALSGTADATVLNKLADGSLLVVRPEVLTTQEAETARHFLRQSNQKVLGTVMNAVDTKQEPQGAFYRRSVESDLSASSRY